MEQRQIFITEFDLKRLRRLILEHKWTHAEGKEYIESLEAELDRGKIVAPEKVPPNVVTMNSKLRVVDLDNDDEFVFTLVFPDEANREQNKVSILAPLGTAVLGYCEGDAFQWKVPDGTHRYRVKEILFQPEAAGRFDL